MSAFGGKADISRTYWRSAQSRFGSYGRLRLWLCRDRSETDQFDQLLDAEQ
jgi:hypothetical protein